MKRTRLYNQGEYLLFRGLLGLLRLFPYPVGKRIVTGLFLLIGYGIGIRREVAEKQLAAVYPSLSSLERKKLLRKLYRNMGLTVAEIYLQPDEDLIANSSLAGREHVDAAFALGRGALLATAHFGNWEAARIFPRFGIPLSVVVKRQHNEYFDRFNNSIREKFGLGIIDFRQGLRDIIAQLRKNEMVAILADQNAGPAGLILDFLGFPASQYKGVAKLSLRYKVPIVPGFALRTEEGKIKFCFEPLIYHPELEDTEENQILVMQEVNSVIEKYIHLHPEQWFWVHKRWKATKAMDFTK